jgi:deoxyribodipyrimidine photo-lyase
MICASRRSEVLVQLDEFVRMAGYYARDRNHVKPGHPSVSRLGPAIRHRLITEDEVVAAVLGAHPFGRVEKFVQEVYWRRYWKSWLALRPEVWSDFLAAAAEDAPRVRRIAEGQSGNAVIDHFANELVTTGYLHNHARMWFAAWWVHQARLPWQAGAAFFFRHLLDGDPASNTLSWRWVAGLQTPGKTYLARRSNLEKYLAPELLEALAAGLAGFENPQAHPPAAVPRPPVSGRGQALETLDPALATGLWIHEEDLSVETSPLGNQSFAAVIATADSNTWNGCGFPGAKRQWLAEALGDAATRAGSHWQAPTEVELKQPVADALVRWAKAKHLGQVAAMRPETGPLNDSVPALRTALADAGLRLVLVERPEDLRVRPFATGGFFQFWDRVRKTLVAPSSGKDSTAPQQLTLEFPP